MVSVTKVFVKNSTDKVQFLLSIIEMADFSKCLIFLLLSICLNCIDAKLKSNTASVGIDFIKFEQMKNNLFTADSAHEFKDGDSTANDECAIELEAIREELNNRSDSEPWALKSIP